jgi:Tol biopolymer transport system component
MNRTPNPDSRLAAWLQEGPSHGPDDGLADACARARSTRQRPGWLVKLGGGTMETTWRARPAMTVRLAFIALTAVLLIAMAASAILIGSRAIGLLDRDGGQMAVATIPQGPEALLAYTSWVSEIQSTDLFVVRADGTDSRRVSSDALVDFSPAWSPDGGEIAVYSGDDDSVQLRVFGADGSVRVVDDTPGCLQSTQAPAWSPDGRFLLYSVDRDPERATCDVESSDVFVVPADGSAPGRRLLAAEHDGYTTLPDWSGDRIVMAGNDGRTGGLWIAEVADPDQPWDLQAARLDGAEFPDRLSFGWPRWSPDGSAIATTYIPAGAGFGSAVVYEPDDPSAQALMADPTRDQIVPDWGPGGSWLTLLELTEQAGDHGIYHLVVVDRDGAEARTIETPELNGNGGPAMVSPDGTLAAARAERDGEAVPGDVLIVSLEGDAPVVRVPAGMWSSVSWQPVVNRDNPAAGAPPGAATP